jgi:TonB family protein
VVKRVSLLSAFLVACALPVPARTVVGSVAGYYQVGDDHSSKEREPEIKEKPEPAALTGKGATWEGKVLVRMILGANGKVSNITILQGGPPEINKRVVKAAKKIKFTPAEKDGRKVSQYVTIEYTFKVY